MHERLVSVCTRHLPVTLPPLTAAVAAYLVTGQVAGGWGAGSVALASTLSALLATLLPVVLRRWRAHGEAALLPRDRSSGSWEDLDRRGARTGASGRAHGDLLTSVGYEARATLNAIIGLVRLLGRTELSPSQDAHVHTVREAAESLLMMLDASLDHARLEAGTLELEEHEFDLDEVLDEVLEVAHPRAVSKGIEVACLVGNDVPRRLVGDQARLRRILLQLMTGATRFSTEGEVDIVVSSTSSGADRVRLCVDVRDAGIGISPERMARLFELDAQGGSIRNEGNAATETGLAVGRSIARRMGGDLDVESQKGVGTTFHLVVELGRALGSSAVLPDPRLAGRRVLVVDASEGSRAAARELLAGLGVECADASDGSRALNALREAIGAGRPFDAALIGTNLVGLDGERLAKKVLRNPTHKNTRVLLTLTSAQELTERRLADVGVSAWVPKPLRRGGVRSALLRALEGELPEEGSLDTRRAAVDVLIAEDDPANRDVIAMQLTELGANVDVASNGKEAVDAVGLKRYDLVLLDCRMPVLSGLAAVRRIRAAPDKRVAELPVVGLTAGALDEDLASCHEAGMDDMLRLPARPEDLRRVLDRWACGEPVEAPDDAGAGVEAAAVDIQLVREQLGIDDDEELLGELVEIFLEDVPARLHELGGAIQAGDWDRTEGIAHYLRSSSSQLGAGPLAALCNRLEEQARGLREECAATAILEDAVAELERVRTSLTGFVAR